MSISGVSGLVSLIHNAFIQRKNVAYIVFELSSFNSLRHHCNASLHPTSAGFFFIEIYNTYGFCVGIYV
jgi:hypothetical protein